MDPITAVAATGATILGVGAAGLSAEAKNNPSTSSLRYTIEELQKQINKLKEAQDACCKAEAVAAAVAAPAPAPAVTETAAAPAPAPAVAEIVAAPAPTPAVAETVAAPAEPSTQRGMFSGLFGSRSTTPTPTAPPAEDLAKEFDDKNRELVQIIRSSIPKAEDLIAKANTAIDTASRSDWFFPELERQRKKEKWLQRKKEVQLQAKKKKDAVIALAAQRAQQQVIPPPPPPQLPLSQRPPIDIPRLLPPPAAPLPPPPQTPYPGTLPGATASNIGAVDSYAGGAWNPFSKSRPVESTPPKPVTQQDKQDTLYHIELLNDKIYELDGLLASYTDLYDRYTGLSLGYQAKIEQIPLIKSILEKIASKTKEVETSFNVVQTDLNKFQAVEAFRQAEIAKATSAAAATAAAAKAAAEAKAKEEYKSTSIQDTLEEKTEAALKWYDETISYFNTHIKGKLIILKDNYAPKSDTSIDDKIIETGRFMDILNGNLPNEDNIGRGKAGLQKAYDDFITEVGTQRSGILGLTRKRKKYPDNAFKGNPTKPVKVRYARPDRVGGKTRRRGGGQKLIDLKARIEAHLEYYNEAKPDIEAFRQEADRFINAKMNEYPYPREEEPEEAHTAAPTAAVPVFEGAEFSNTNPLFQGSKGESTFKALQQTSSRKRNGSTPTTNANPSPRSATPAGTAPLPPPLFPGLPPAPNTGAAGPNAPLPPMPFPPSDRSKIQGESTKFGGPLPRGGLRKKKLRSRRGGKQKKNVRRTRRS